MVKTQLLSATTLNMSYTTMISKRKKIAIVATSFSGMLQLEALSLQLNEVVLLRRTLECLDLQELIELKPDCVYVDNLFDAKKYGLQCLLKTHSIKIQEIKVSSDN